MMINAAVSTQGAASHLPSVVVALSAGSRGSVNEVRARATLSSHFDLCAHGMLE